MIFFKVFNLFSPLKSYEKVELNCGILQNDFFFIKIYFWITFENVRRRWKLQKNCFPEILFLSKVAFYMKCSTDNFTDLKQQRIPFHSFLFLFSSILALTLSFTLSLFQCFPFLLSLHVQEFSLTSFIPFIIVSNVYLVLLFWHLHFCALLNLS